MGMLIDDAHTEPTLGDKLESLDLFVGEKQSIKDSAPSVDKPPTVIGNSVAKLNSVEVLKLLNSLIPILQSSFSLFDSVDKVSVTYSFQWDYVMSQELSLIALNSMYQVGNCMTVQVSSCLDLIVDDLDEEEEDAGPVIYEEKDSYEEEGEGTEEAMETDEEADESEDEAADGVNDFEDFDEMSE
ncbi:hypothetical protein Rs2_29762 [Raphanus sativus]|nr:hypothetical protein Rs2_29762 [Raphanus sativus]